jgi:hypothetical protein
VNDKIGAASALMNETDLLIQLVLVTPDDRDHEVWAALTSSEEAISRVLAAVPTGWSASLLDIRVTPHESSQLKLQAGEIRKLRE